MTNKELSYILTLRDNFSTSWSKAMNNAQASMARMKAQLGQVQGWIGAAFSFAAIKHLEDEYLKAQAATGLLGQSLEKLGAAARLPEFEQMATDLQNLTGYSDEQIKSGQRLLLNITQNADAAKQFTPLVLDLARTMGIEVDQAAKMIGKTQEGSDALKRLGINIGKTSSESERLTKIQAELTRIVGGSAEAFGKTAQGMEEIRRQKLSDLFEDFGKLVHEAIEPFREGMVAVVDLLKASPTPIKAAALAVAGLTAAMFALNIPMGGLPIIIGSVVTGLVAFSAWAKENGVPVLDKLTAGVETFIDSFLPLQYAIWLFGTALPAAFNFAKEAITKFIAETWEIQAALIVIEKAWDAVSGAIVRAGKIILGILSYTPGLNFLASMIKSVIAVAGETDRIDLSKTFLTSTGAARDLGAEIYQLSRQLLDMDPGSDAYIAKLKEMEALEKIGKTTLGELNQQLASLNAQLQNMIPGSAEFLKTQKEIAAIQKILSGTTEDLSTKTKAAAGSLDFFKQKYDELAKKISGTPITNKNAIEALQRQATAAAIALVNAERALDPLLVKLGKVNTELKKLSLPALDATINLPAFKPIKVPVSFDIDTASMTDVSDILNDIQTLAPNLSAQWAEMAEHQRMIATHGQEFVDALESAEAMYANLMVVSNAFFSTLSEAGHRVWTEIFGTANSLFEQFMSKVIGGLIDNLLNKIQKNLFEKAAGSFLKNIPIIGWFFHQGGTVPKAHDGAFVDPNGALKNLTSGSRFLGTFDIGGILKQLGGDPTQTNSLGAMQFLSALDKPIMVRGGETIRNAAQEKSIKQLIETAQAIRTYKAFTDGLPLGVGPKVLESMFPKDAMRKLYADQAALRGRTFQGPASQEFAIRVRGGETIRTEMQEMEIQRLIAEAQQYINMLPRAHSGAMVDASGALRGLQMPSLPPTRNSKLATLPGALSTGSSVQNIDNSDRSDRRIDNRTEVHINIDGPITGVEQLTSVVKKAVQDGMRKTNLTVEQYFVNDRSKTNI